MVEGGLRESYRENRRARGDVKRKKKPYWRIGGKRVPPTRGWGPRVRGVRGNGGAEKLWGTKDRNASVLGFCPVATLRCRPEGGGKRDSFWEMGKRKKKQGKKNR